MKEGKREREIEVTGSPSRHIQTVCFLYPVSEYGHISGEEAVQSVQLLLHRMQSLSLQLALFVPVCVCVCVCVCAHTETESQKAIH